MVNEDKDRKSTESHRRSVFGRKERKRIMGAEAEEQEKQGTEKPKPNSITQAQFLSWKRQKDADASARKAEATRKRAEDIAAGTVQMNGRELFLHEPWVFDDPHY